MSAEPGWIPSIGERSWPGWGSLIIAVHGYLFLPGRALLCAVKYLVLQVDHELLVFSHVDEPTVADVAVIHPIDAMVTLRDILHLPAEGQACFADPFTELCNHRVTIAVRGDPSGSTLAEYCLFVDIKAIESTATRPSSDCSQVRLTKGLSASAN